MLKWLKKNTSDQRRTRDLYAAIVAQSRMPAFYADIDVPDTINGRFEMLTLHMFMMLTTIQGQSATADEAGRLLTEVMFEQVDDAMRGMGVADLKVYKKVYSAAGDFYGRIQAYSDALQTDGPTDMQNALARNVFDEAPSKQVAERLTSYVFENLAHLAPQLDAIVADGKVTFRNMQ